MSACRVKLDLEGDAESFVTKANDAIHAEGGKFTGNAQQGSFEFSTPIGAIKGSYTIDNSSIDIQITNKPMLLSCGKIEKELRHYLNA